MIAPDWKTGLKMVSRKNRAKQVKLNFGRLLKQAGFESYEAYLQGPHWQSVRRKCCPKGTRCTACRGEVSLNLHHVSYRRLGHEKPTDLLLLCETCHGRLHKALDAAYPGKSLGFKAEQTRVVFTVEFGAAWPDTHGPIRKQRTKPKRRKKHGSGLSKNQKRGAAIKRIRERQAADHCRILAEKHARQEQERAATRLANPEEYRLSLLSFEERVRERIELRKLRQPEEQRARDRSPQLGERCETGLLLPTA